LCLQELGEFGMRIFTTTDDGTAGDQCLVTDPVEIALSKHRPDMIYACGPMAMLKCLAGLVQAERIPCQVSIETMMGCGTGACLGCAVENRKDPERYYHACMDGPVFDIYDLKL
jgi:dihydroorotate dehydrogenase electron transfer subunit